MMNREGIERDLQDCGLEKELAPRIEKSFRNYKICANASYVSLLVMISTAFSPYFFSPTQKIASYLKVPVYSPISNALDVLTFGGGAFIMARRFAKKRDNWEDLFEDLHLTAENERTRNDNYRNGKNNPLPHDENIYNPEALLHRLP